MTTVGGVDRVSATGVTLAATSATSAQHVLHRSEDGRMLAGVFAESGDATLHYDYTEFLVVVSGTVSCRVEGGESFTLRVGDCAVIHAGTTVHLTMSDDFRDACLMVGANPIPY